MSKNARKGQVYRRKGDGFVFVVMSASRSASGAFMQCLDAAMVYGFWSDEDRARSFDKVSKAEAKNLAQASAAHWATTTKYANMQKLAADTLRRNTV